MKKEKFKKKIRPNRTNIKRDMAEKRKNHKSTWPHQNVNNPVNDS